MELKIQAELSIVHQCACGWIMKTLDKESKRYPPQRSTVYEAVLRFFEYDATFTPEAFSGALAALKKAVIVDPEYGPAWSLLARLYAQIFVIDIPGYKDPLEKAFECAQNGTRLSPADQRCSAAMAYIHLFRNCSNSNPTSPHAAGY